MFGVATALEPNPARFTANVIDDLADLGNASSPERVALTAVLAFEFTQYCPLEKCLLAVARLGPNLLYGLP